MALEKKELDGARDREMRRAELKENINKILLSIIKEGTLADIMKSKKENPFVTSLAKGIRQMLVNYNKNPDRLASFQSEMITKILAEEDNPGSLNKDLLDLVQKRYSKRLSDEDRQYLYNSDVVDVLVKGAGQIGEAGEDTEGPDINLVELMNQLMIITNSQKSEDDEIGNRLVDEADQQMATLFATLHDYDNRKQIGLVNGQTA